MTSPTFQWFAFQSNSHSSRYGYGTAPDAAQYLTYLGFVYGAGVYRCVPLSYQTADELALESGQVLRCCDLNAVLADIRSRCAACVIEAITTAPHPTEV
jgi:hypothetical protein